MPGFYTPEAVDFLERFQIIPPARRRVPPYYPSLTGSSSRDQGSSRLPIDALSLIDLIVHANTLYMSFWKAADDRWNGCSPAPHLAEEFDFTWDFGRQVLGPSLFSCLMCYLDPSYDVVAIRRDVRTVLDHGNMPYRLDQEPHLAGFDAEYSQDSSQSETSSVHTVGTRSSSDNDSPSLASTGTAAPIHGDDSDEDAFCLDPATSTTKKEAQRREWQVATLTTERTDPPVSHVAPLLLSITTAIGNAFVEISRAIKQTPAFFRAQGMPRLPWVISPQREPTLRLVRQRTFVRTKARAPPPAQGNALGLVLSRQQHQPPHGQGEAPYHRQARHHHGRGPNNSAPSCGRKRNRHDLPGALEDSHAAISSPPPLHGSTLRRLPAELMQHILEFVAPRYTGTVVSVVCRAWRELATVRSPILRLYADASRRVTVAYETFLREYWGECALSMKSMMTFHRVPVTAVVSDAGEHLSLLRALLKAREARMAQKDFHPTSAAQARDVAKLAPLFEALCLSRRAPTGHDHSGEDSIGAELVRAMEKHCGIAAYEHLVGLLPAKHPARRFQTTLLRAMLTEIKDPALFSSLKLTAPPLTRPAVVETSYTRAQRALFVEAMDGPCPAVMRDFLARVVREWGDVRAVLLAHAV